jgi:hypothetical protein
VTIVIIHPDATPAHLGAWPDIFREDDPRPGAEQANDRYVQGGGWMPMQGFSLDKTGRLTYPHDPPLDPMAMMWLPLSDEMVMFYPHAMVAIVAKGGFEVARMD